MVNKNQLLKDLSTYSSFEEDAIQKYSTFSKALGWRYRIDKQYHGIIEQGLNRLRADSEKHANLIRSILKYVEESDKNEF